MRDLAEHIELILAIVSGLIIVCGVLIKLIANDYRRKLEEVKKEAGKFSEWLKEVGKEGGRLVTEKLYFQWCKEQQAQCEACESYRLLIDWRNTMNEKGGPMLKLEHLAFCKEVTKEVTDHFCERLDEMLKHHRELVTAELNLLRVELTKRRDA